MTDETVAKARGYFVENYNCAQSVLRSVLEKYDLYFEEATTSMAGMGGGVGLEGNVCGALIGGVAALGVLNSRKFKDYEEQKEATYIDSAKLIYKFKKKFKTAICDDLTGITMADKSERDEAIEKGVFQTTCPKYLEEVIRIIVDMQSSE